MANRTRIYHIGLTRNGCVTETFERVDMCVYDHCSSVGLQNLYVTQPHGNALCIKCCIGLHGKIWKNKNGN